LEFKKVQRAVLIPTYASVGLSGDFAEHHLMP